MSLRARWQRFVSWARGAGRRLQGTEGQLYRTLLRQAGGDPETAQRLIDYELQRRPGATRDQAIRSAIWRLDRDRT